MANFPTAGYVSDNARTEGELKTALEDWLAATKQLPGGNAESELTIASGSVTPTRGVHQVDTEADAASDDLTNIVQTNLPDGSLLLLRNVTAGRTVVVKHSAGGAGQIALTTGADFSLDEPEKWLLLKRTGSLWEEVDRFLGDDKAARRAQLGLDVIPNVSYVFNGDFEIWGSGTAAAPTRWSLTGSGATVSRDTAIVKIGAAAAQVARNGADVTLLQRIDQIWAPLSWWQGRTITFGAWVRSTAATTARLTINDGVGESNSAYHSGAAAFEFLTVTRTIDPAATQVQVELEINNSNATVRIDGATLVLGRVLTDFIPGAWRGRKAIVHWTTATEPVTANSTEYAGLFKGVIEDAPRLQFPFKGVARNLYAHSSAAPGSSQSYIYRLRKLTGGVDTALTCTISGAAQSEANDVVNEVECAKGELWVMKITASATAVSSRHAGLFEYEEIP